MLDLDLQPVASEKLYDFGNVRAADGAGVWRATWKCGANMTCVAWNVGQPGERALVADGWGQRDWKNSDIGATIPYVVRRCEGDGVRTFISVFEGHAGGEPFVRSVKLSDPSGVLLVETALGHDYVMSRLDTGTLPVPTAAGPKAYRRPFRRRVGAGEEAGVDVCRRGPAADITFTDGGIKPMIEDDHQPYDKSSKWLIQHHGDSMLRLARIERIAAWRPAQAEVAQPRQLPDGLLEVRLEGESRDDLFLIEVGPGPGVAD